MNTSFSNEEDGPKVSVIIPVYKVEAYLRPCIESVINQTYKTLEIWLVDDGSPDSCPNICDEYARKDERIKVIHKANGGLSDARNAAIELMTGDYVTFVDSDDFISTEYVSMLLKLCHDNDCLISSIGMRTFIDESTISQQEHVEYENCVINQHDAIKSIANEGIFLTSACGKLYKSSLFVGVRYPKGKIYEDLATTYKLIDKVDKVACSSLQLYYYRYNPVSIMNEKVSNRTLDIIYSHELLIEYVERKYPDLVPTANSRYCRYCSAFLFRFFAQRPDDNGSISLIISKIKPRLKYLLCSNYGLSKKIFAICAVYLTSFTKILIKKYRSFWI